LAAVEAVPEDPAGSMVAGLDILASWVQCSADLCKLTANPAKIAPGAKALRGGSDQSSADQHGQGSE